VAADIRRGDLYWIDWSPARGSEQAGLRPGLVVQNDVANAVSGYPVTMQIMTVQKDRLGTLLGRLAAADMARVEEKLAYMLGLVR
jgi:mRNA interferase MazF